MKRLCIIKRIIFLSLLMLCAFFLVTPSYAREKGDEASDVENKKTSKQKVSFVIYANPQCIFPVDEFDEKVNIGFGASISFRAENLFVDNYFIGSSIHFFNFKGKNDYRQLSMVPIMATTGYGIPFWRCTFKLLLRFGVTFNSLLRYNDSAHDSYSRQETFHPILMVGTYFDVLVAKNYMMQLGSDFGNIFEEERNRYFFVLTLGLGLRF